MTTDRYVPRDPILEIGTKQIDLPYTIRQTQPFFQHSPDRQTMRRVYMTESYAIGSGNVRHSPGGFYLDDSKFGITYTDDEDAFVTIQSTHPYWRSDYGENSDRSWSGPTSPFLQIGHHENSGVLLFSIPEDDPYPRQGRPEWYRTRDGVDPSAEENDYSLTQVGQVRFPKTIDEWTQDGDWVFLRENDVYIGIKALVPSPTIVTDAQDDYILINSYAAKTGFAFEVGTAADFATFAAFQTALKANVISIDWATVDVTYTDTDGDSIRVLFNEETAGLDSSIPRVWLNGDEEDWVNWPALESPAVNLSNQVLTVDGLTERITVDWTSTYPVISQAALPAGSPLPRLMAALSADGANLEITFTGTVGDTYQLETSLDLDSWNDVGSTISATGSEQMVLVPIPSGDRLFVRLRAL
jgi:hypothetical protein